MAAPWWEHPRRPPAQKSMDRFAVLWMKAYATCCDLSEAARIWMADARADGWRIDGKLYLQEPLSRACTMTREDLRAICICRNEPPILRHLPAGCITLWKGCDRDSRAVDIRLADDKAVSRRGGRVMRSEARRASAYPKFADRIHGRNMSDRLIGR